MKKYFVFFLSVILLLSLTACGGKDITMEELYDANQSEVLLKNYDSICVRHYDSGVLYEEIYHTKDFTCDGDGQTWVTLFTDDAYYGYNNGLFYRLVYLSPQSLLDTKSHRAEMFASPFLTPETMLETVQSVTKSDNRITVSSFLDQKAIESAGTYMQGIVSNRCEYELDAKTHAVYSAKYTIGFDDGTEVETGTQCSYNEAVPQLATDLLAYANQTEDLRTVTIVSHAVTGEEYTATVQAPKGLVVGLSSLSGTNDEFLVYADADFTEPFQDTTGYMEDVTVHVKWLV